MPPSLPLPKSKAQNKFLYLRNLRGGAVQIMHTLGLKNLGGREAETRTTLYKTRVLHDKSPIKCTFVTLMKGSENTLFSSSAQCTLVRLGQK